jgi:hypothetical protein
MKDTFWDMTSRIALVRTNVSKVRLPSIFRVNDFEFPWISARMYFTTDGEESLSL